MPSTTPYALPEHRHRFAVWTAARATARNFARTAEVRRAIEGSEMPEVIADPSRWPDTQDDVDQAHRRWAGQMQEVFKRLGKQPKATYGRMAKIIAIYVKTVVVIPGSEHPFAALAHPPVDRILLRTLAEDPRFDANDRVLWRASSWTKLDVGAYFAIIESLRRAAGGRAGLWTLEEYFQPDGTAGTGPAEPTRARI